ncbi:MAG TPA: hypothetical protein VF538_19560 [Pyrinomonadaceae bacterium]|jgi:hypothetical protein
MIPHRAKLALAAACCALASCLDARVPVTISVVPIDKNQNAQTMKGIRLTVFKAAPLLDEEHPQYAKCAGESFEPQLSDMEGKTTFHLLPGDYEVCTEEQSYNNEKFKWGVPFRIAAEGLHVPQLVEDEVTFVGCGRVEQRARLLRWKYPEATGGRAGELLLTRDNSLDRTQPTQPAPPLCSTPTPSPSPSPSPSAPPAPTASPAAQPAASPAASPGAQPAPARVQSAPRRRRR